MRFCSALSSWMPKAVILFGRRLIVGQAGARCVIFRFRIQYRGNRRIAFLLFTVRLSSFQNTVRFGKVDIPGAITTDGGHALDGFPLR